MDWKKEDESFSKGALRLIFEKVLKELRGRIFSVARMEQEKKYGNASIKFDVLFMNIASKALGMESRIKPSTLWDYLKMFVAYMGIALLYGVIVSNVMKISFSVISFLITGVIAYSFTYILTYFFALWGVRMNKAENFKTHIKAIDVTLSLQCYFFARAVFNRFVADTILAVVFFEVANNLLSYCGFVDNFGFIMILIFCCFWSIYETYSAFKKGERYYKSVENRVLSAYSIREN